MNQNNNSLSKKLRITNIHEIVKGMKIKDLQNFEPIKEQFRRVFMMIGLSEVPQNEAKDLLHSYVYENYGHLNPVEIGKAFELALQNKFTVDLSHYNNFSIMYFSKVMNAYLEWRGRELTRPGTQKQNVQRLPLSNESHNRKEYFLRCFIEPYEKLLSKNVYEFHSLDELCLYHTLRNLGLAIPVTPSAKSKAKATMMSDKDVEDKVATKILEYSFREWIMNQAELKVDLRKLVIDKIK